MQYIIDVMVQKEIIEFSTSTSEGSKAMKPIIDEILKDNSELSYSRVDYDKEMDLMRSLISSQPPTVTPFFVVFNDGKPSGSISGVVSEEDLKDIIN
jgi:thioredoxin-like negative regulator of GroEL